jgi:ABC-type phosphate/phosphonate transport system substrate-binding protein
VSLRVFGVAAIVAVALAGSVNGDSTPPIKFLSYIPNAKYQAADDALVKSLADRTGAAIQPEPQKDNNTLIHQVAEWRRGAYVARMTPYVYLAAWMLGAHFEVLATYKSESTKSMTYRSYFVVNRGAWAAWERGGELARAPTLDNLRDYLKSFRDRKPQFSYHDEFSTSSYFLPALWLRSQQIFHMASPMQGLSALDVTAQNSYDEKKGDGSDLHETGSTALVLSVAAGNTDIAAVWDGTKKDFDKGGRYAEAGSKVAFIPLAQQLPNDVLVSSASLDNDVKQRILKVVDPELSIGKGDFTSWVPIAKAAEANHALSELRETGAAPPAPVVVKVDAAGVVEEAVVKALRLSWPEFVLFDPVLHQTYDILWTVTPIHDGVQLATSFNDQKLEQFHLDQTFPISFISAQDDLTTRILTLIHSRMHRVRYIWPYDKGAPTVLGDVDFKLDPGSPVYVLPITWNDDPHNNQFSRGEPFASIVGDSDFYRFNLKPESFRGSDYHDPLSNAAYRVILTRPTHESRVSKYGTLAVVVVLLAGAIGAGLDLRRRPATAAVPVATVSLDEECLAMVRSSHGEWNRPLNDADVLWCDRNQIEEIVEDLKTKNLASFAIGGKERTSVARTWAAKLSLPIGKGTVSVGDEHSSVRELVADPSKVPSPARLSALLRLMIDRDLLSPFAGRPLEWDGLASAFTRTVGVVPGADTTAAGVLNPQDAIVRDLVSRHFDHVVDEALAKPSLFRAQWSIGKRDQAMVAMAPLPLAGPLDLGRDRSRTEALRLEFEVPQQALSRVSAGSQTFWLMGKILGTDIASKSGTGPTLCLRFAPIALLADPDSSATFLRRRRRV